MKKLSKSKLLAFRQCERRLWLEVKHPELCEDSSATKASYSLGNQVGELAQEIYDPKKEGTLINPQEEGFKSAFSRTSDLIKKRKRHRLFYVFISLAGWYNFLLLIF